MPGIFSYTAATNTVTVTGGTSGSPADFASVVAADRAGAGTSLLAAWSPNSNTKALTFQVRPVELLALLISFVVAGKTAETDYIFITGTDAWGATQTESLDISAGDGTYVTAKRFKTITDIDCSDNAAGGGAVWADGTVAVTQPIWGVIWNKGNGQYQLDGLVKIGDGSTTTYFADSGKQITISGFYATGAFLLEVKTNATFTDGQLDDLTTKRTKNGNSYYIQDAPGVCQSNIVNNGTMYLYSTKFNSYDYYNLVIDNPTRAWNLHLYRVYFARANDTYNIVNENSAFLVYTTGSYQVYKSRCTGINTIGLGAFSNTTYLLNEIEALNLINAAVQLYSFTGRYYVIDCVFDNWTINWTGTPGAGNLYRQYTLALHLTDLLGNNIAGATVILTNPLDGTVVNTSTGEDGKITFTGQNSSSVANAVTHTRHYYSGGAQSEYKGPWTLTITAPGYQTYQDVITIDRKMDLEVALLALGGGVSPTNLGLVPLGIKQVAI